MVDRSLSPYYLQFVPCRQDKMKAENLSEAAILAFKNSYAALVSV